MEIIFRDHHNATEISTQFNDILALLQEQYHIQQFREVHIELTLVDAAGYDVELVDTQTNTAYRFLEVYDNPEFRPHELKGSPRDTLIQSNNTNKKSKTHVTKNSNSKLRLVVDNTINPTNPTSSEK